MPQARLAALALAALAVGCGCPGEELGVVDGELARSFCVEIARTEAERRQGLRGHDPLGPGEGLWLVASVESELCIVNDGVSFDLDLLYLDAAGVAVGIERGVPAEDPTPRCHAPARSVLEVAAGELDGLGVGAHLDPAPDPG